MLLGSSAPILLNSVLHRALMLLALTVIIQITTGVELYGQIQVAFEHDSYIQVPSKSPAPFQKNLTAAQLQTTEFTAKQLIIWVCLKATDQGTLRPSRSWASHLTEWPIKTLITK